MDLNGTNPWLKMTRIIGALQEFCIFTLRNICCVYLLELPRRGDSNKYSRHMFHGVIKKKKEAEYNLSYYSLLEFFMAANSYEWQNLREEILPLRGMIEKFLASCTSEYPGIKSFSTTFQYNLTSS